MGPTTKGGGTTALVAGDPKHLPIRVIQGIGASTFTDWDQVATVAKPTGPMAPFPKIANGCGPRGGLLGSHP